MAESTFDPDLFASLIEDVSRLKVGAGIDQVEVKPVETATRIKEKLLVKFDQYRLPRMSLAEFYEYALLETRQRLDAATERNRNVCPPEESLVYVPVTYLALGESVSSLC